jgi:hypothetical protein
MFSPLSGALRKHAVHAAACALVVGAVPAAYAGTSFNGTSFNGTSFNGTATSGVQNPKDAAASVSRLFNGVPAKEIRLIAKSRHE